ncbi:hypothetical protein BABINDRAFT_158896 [Babjeviella inositovora NRRL Y-12698]|uniref:CHCH domain-containing protein n=1 Tax=Babjeviella inositovora NRRL Y-12698 TaxID=984486 RepID=A0A1E3QX59_9ASCO|nr:uncharacterized protein BABINDRAFT_158896 [Babjeviella inositovora NRRL Y-12698]ODQ82263.1 hypothetical protein BABINDRAFT_158896 [Babjeviella inositovora NRRL Y-12698]
MARSSGRSAPARRAAPVQTRSAHSAAAPAPARVHAPAPATATAPAQPGMFAQMAATAGAVAVGSAVGHTLGAGITSMFSGSSSESVQQAAAPAQQFSQEQTKQCDADARSFTRCLEDNQGNMQACDYYLQQLKACQQAASQY